MKGVTIDQLDIKDHVRWAEDQNQLDISFVKESHMVALHPKILGTSVIYPSKFEELFDLQKRNPSWASFTPPKNFHSFSKRFFTDCLFSAIQWEEKEDDSSQEQQEDDDNDSVSQLIQLIMQCQNPSHQPESLFEKDKTSILNLFKSIDWISKLLKHVHARRLQYQKG